MTNYTKQEINQILTLRYHQHLLNEDLKKGKFKIPVHLAFGHEAIAVAIKNLVNKVDAKNKLHNFYAALSEVQ